MTDLTHAVVVTHNSADYLGGCLRSLSDAGLTRVTVWDNDSDDASLEIALGLLGEDCVVASDQNLGFGAAVNRAVQRDNHAELVLLVNPDALATRAAVASCTDLLVRDSSVGIVAPSMVLPSGERIPAGGPSPSLFKELVSVTRVDEFAPKWLVDQVVRRTRRLPLARTFADYAASASEGEPLQLEWVSGFFLFIKRETWDAVGGFDERFFLYFEDVALCEAVRSLGLRVVQDRRVAVVHDESASSTTVGKNQYYYDAFWSYLEKYGTGFQRRVAGMRRRIWR